MSEIKPMLKSYTFLGTNGSALVLAETPDRREIEVSIGAAKVRITAEQFQLLNRLDSSYDGLQVESTQSEPEAHSPDYVDPASEALNLVGIDVVAGGVIDAEFDEVRREE